MSLRHLDLDAIGLHSGEACALCVEAGSLAVAVELVRLGDRAVDEPLVNLCRVVTVVPPARVGLLVGHPLIAETRKGGDGYAKNAVKLL